MRGSIEVESREEGKLIELGLTEPDVRALAKAIGAIAGIENPRAQVRVLAFVCDLLSEKWDIDLNDMETAEIRKKYPTY